jgi:hypothetical protein
VITGFNTDVQFNGKAYHVQTEDKGMETPFILTLVYDGGTILASKRQPYDDLFTGGFSEKDLSARLQRQHSLICAAIGSGRLADLIALTNGNRQKVRRRGANGIPKPGTSKDEPNAIPKPEVQMEPERPTIKASEPVADPLPFVEEVIEIPDEAIEVPDDAIEIVSLMAGKERPVHNRLCLEFVNETSFRGGERKTVTFMVSRGTERKVVGNAQILVKILGANIRPQIFHSITDQNGLARMDLEVPEFSGGRAAFLVRATNAGEEIEIRRPILQS